MKKRLLSLLAAWTILGTGFVNAGTTLQETIQILPPRIERLAPGLSTRLVTGLGRNLRRWEIRPRNQPGGFRLATVLLQGADNSLRLEATLLPGMEKTPLFKKAYTGSLALFDWMLTRLADDLAVHLQGQKTPDAHDLLLVQEVGQGVSEIVLTNAVGSQLKQLTRHGSLTHSPTSVRNGRFAYITYVMGPPQIWGMDLKHRQPKRLYPPLRGQGVVSDPALSPDGRTLAFVENDKQGRQAIRILDWDSGETRTITLFDFCNEAPAWSPDGKQLVFIHGRLRQEAIVVITPEGNPARTFALEQQHLRDPAWSQDGSRIVFTAVNKGGTSELKTLELASGTVNVLFSGEGAFSSPRWGPDDRWIAYAVGGIETRLFNIENGSNRSLLEGFQAHHSPRWVR
ncbi:MAG: hypothetical protein Q8O00_06775 [Holophaga sp.]|nr:hypothetical protein [Holophaga sp.]